MRVAKTEMVVDSTAAWQIVVQTTRPSRTPAGFHQRIVQLKHSHESHPGRFPLRGVVWKKLTLMGNVRLIMRTCALLFVSGNTSGPPKLSMFIISSFAMHQNKAS